MDHARPRYLEAKRTVDERALSRRVRDRLLASLPAEPRILEAGSGTGVTVPRLRSWGVDAGTYRGVDADPRIVAFARDARPAALRRAGYDVAVDPPGSGDEAAPSDFAVDDLAVRFEVGDALDAMASARDVDLVVAQAFADLVPLPRLVDAAASALRPGGLAYLPITFDGGTIFQPDHPADDAVEAAYHAAIDARSDRDVRAGRHLADLLRRRDGDLLAVGSADWIVRPRDGSYPADERYFLSRILEFVAEAVPSSPREAPGFESWLDARRRHLDAGELTYVAHQYDLLYRTPGE